MPSDKAGTSAYYQMDRVADKGKGAGQGGRRGGSLRHTTTTWQQKIPELPAAGRATFQRDPGHAKKKCKEGENHDILSAGAISVRLQH